MKTLGGTGPRVGCTQRRSASAQLTSFVGERDLRLKPQRELTALERAAKIGLEVELLRRALLDLVGEEHVARTARRLGVVHCRIGVLQQNLVGVAVLGILRDTDARRREDLLAVDLDRALEHRHDLAGDGLDLGHAEHLRQDDHELVPAQARDRVGFAHACEQPRGDLAQELVAHGMTERVVDGLEAVEIEIEHGQLAVVAPDLRERLVQPVPAELAVREPCQRVEMRLIEQRGLALRCGHRDREPIGEIPAGLLFDRRERAPLGEAEQQCAGQLLVGLDRIDENVGESRLAERREQLRGIYRQRVHAPILT